MKQLLTTQQAAEKLKVSPWTIRSWCSRKMITYIKMGGSVRFDEVDLDKWIQSHKIKAKYHTNATYERWGE